MIEISDYNDFGLAVGLISYPFNEDGKDLFNEVFKNDLFYNHRNNLSKLTPETLDWELYTPRGYRLFGSYGLAVLSLIDDYAFCNRIFNDNHTHTSTTKKWGAKIITGISDSKDYLLHKAQQTFLRNEQKYPFIGIMKLKIDHRLLFGEGINFTILVKKAISNAFLAFIDPESSDYFIVDCFDNDELSVFAFSNDLYSIHAFFHEIQGLSNQQIKKLVSEKSGSLFIHESDAKDVNKQLFVSCYINLGYDVEYKTDNTNFLSLNKHSDGSSSLNPKLNFICETKPGHDNEFKSVVSTYFRRLKIEYELSSNITGGSITLITLPVEMISAVEKLCIIPEFNKHVQRVKVSLKSFNTEYITINESNKSIHKYEPKGFDVDFISKIKRSLNQCGVSKVVRERLLSIYRLYNDSIGNLLHAAYFEELYDSLLHIETLIEKYSHDAAKPIKEMDKELTSTISAFEEAFYNRFHEKGMSNANLEYNGSIQQYLTSFNFLYKQILRGISPSQGKESESYRAAFASITGYERVSSTKMNLQLNINQITYPEFFATTILKEAANHVNPLMVNYPVPSETCLKEFQMRFSLWKSFVSSENSFNKIKFFLDKDMLTVYNDEIFRIVHDRLDKELLDYLVLDQFVYHFGFQRNFELYWHFYWKTFLQTSNSYFRNGQIDRSRFIEMLFRLIMVGISDYSKIPPDDINAKCTQDAFLNEQENKPYDSLLSDLWFTCFCKIRKCAKNIYNTLNIYEYAELCEDVISVTEHQLARLTPYADQIVRAVGKEAHKNGKEVESFRINRQILNYRDKVALDMRRFLLNHQLVIPNPTAHGYEGGVSPDYGICLLHAFLCETIDLDFYKKQDPVIKSVPRDVNGNKHHIIKDVLDNMINMPTDPFGGLLIPDFSIRKRYFSLRTTLYRSMWHYKMISEKFN